MNLRRVMALAGLAGLALWTAAGCTNVDQLMDPDPRFDTLVVAYGHPGPSAAPCDDVLPRVDGVAADVEWSSATPRYVRMSGANGNGGRDYFLEVRAIWTDDGKLGGADRIFFMIRFEDDDQNEQPDQLAYIYPATPGELCPDDAVFIEGVRYCTSPSPVLCGSCSGSNRFDEVIVTPGMWTRLNKGGREDAVVVLIKEVMSPEEESGLIELNGEVLGLVGPEIPEGAAVTGSNTALWIWRAGRTNRHPIPQYADWENPDLFTRIPPPVDSKFPNVSGFCEDAWIGNFALQSDNGLKPFRKNFNKFIVDVANDTTWLPDVPVRMTQCPPSGREPSEEELQNLNGRIPKDLGLWWPTARFFQKQDTLACSRTGAIRNKWSQGLLSGEYDKVQGWGLDFPYTTSDGRTSGRDVRARGLYEASQEKGFGVHTLEIMRDLDTGQPDDLRILPGDTTREYRIVIGVFDRSGRQGSGSTEIRLRFEAPKARQGGAVNQCS